MLNRVSLSLTLLSLIALAGCSPPWAVVTQSGPPSALAGATEIYVQFDFNQSTIDHQPIAQAFSTLPPDEVADIQGTFDHMMEDFATGLQAGLSYVTVRQGNVVPPNAVLAQVIVGEIVRGSSGPMGRATQMSAQVQWVRDGQPVDRIAMGHSVRPSFTRPSVAQRLRGIATQLGSWSARFFDKEQSR